MDWTLAATLFLFIGLPFILGIGIAIRERR